VARDLSLSIPNPDDAGSDRTPSVTEVTNDAIPISELSSPRRFPILLLRRVERERQREELARLQDEKRSTSPI
jgi:hypothetical protein